MSGRRAKALRKAQRERGHGPEDLDREVKRDAHQLRWVRCRKCQVRFMELSPVRRAKGGPTTVKVHEPRTPGMAAVRSGVIKSTGGTHIHMQGRTHSHRNRERTPVKKDA